MTAITVNFNSIAKIGDEQFYRLCIDNPDTKFERNAQGEIIIVSPQHVRRCFASDLAEQGTGTNVPRSSSPFGDRIRRLASGALH